MSFESSKIYYYRVNDYACKVALAAAKYTLAFSNCALKLKLTFKQKFTFSFRNLILFNHQLVILLFRHHI